MPVEVIKDDGIYSDAGARRISWEEALRVYQDDKGIPISMEAIHTLVLIDSVGPHKLDEVDAVFEGNIEARKKVLDTYRLRICTLK